MGHKEEYVENALIPGGVIKDGTLWLEGNGECTGGLDWICYTCE